MVTKKKSTTRKHASSKKYPPMRSFVVAKDVPPFFTFKITKQTFYWSLLVLAIIIMQLWILKVQLDVAQVTDNINALLGQ
jgi:hypothetical protein